MFSEKASLIFYTHNAEKVVAKRNEITSLAKHAEKLRKESESELLLTLKVCVWVGVGVMYTRIIKRCPVCVCVCVCVCTYIHSYSELYIHLLRVI